VTERPLSDGRALIHLRLRTSNALAAAPAGFAGDFTQPLFGSDPGAVLAGAPPALAESRLDLKFIAPAVGAPLPDLVQLSFFPEPGQELLQEKFHASAVGELHASFGVPEGTLGRLIVQQVGVRLHNPRPHGKVSDGFPVEFIKLQTLGR
jgi:hypothetical protein